MSRVYAALVHYPVCNRKGEEITTAVTNLDIHDIARSALTFGLRGYYLIQPDEEQQEICREIIHFWQEGYGLKYNPDRAKALEKVKLTADLAETIEQIIAQEGEKPQIVVTSANMQENTVSFARLRDKIADGGVYLILFGTGWGLTKEMLSKADICLAPIKGNGEYNHLSVRSAAAIVFDRLLGM